ncbi:MAG: hypothetical protein QME45_12460 [Clostridiales bacterium]|nr:hypothetical protein [Clostridiales bacterium]HBM80512.1 hypothetical protein [Clostridiaceae bacterium]
MAEFFEKFTENMGKYLTAAGIKSSELIDITSVNMEISNLEKQKNKILMEIGRHAYAMYLKGGIDGKKLDDKCDILVRIDKEIKGKKAEKEMIHESAKKILKNTVGKNRNKHH